MTDRAGGAAGAPVPGFGPVRATRSRRRVVATSPLSSATAPHSRNTGDTAQAASYVRVTGEVGEAAAVSARHTTCTPARGPSRASRATASRTSAPPGSPSTTTTVYGPVKPPAGSAPSSGRAQEGCGRTVPAAAAAAGVSSAVSRGRAPGRASSPRWSSRRRSSSAARAVACSRSWASSSRQSWPCPGRTWGSQPSQDHSAVRSASGRERSALIRTISRVSAECSAASWASTERASPVSRSRGPARPSAPTSRRPAVTGTAGSGASPPGATRSAVPSRTVSASGWPGPRSHSRGPGPSAVSSSDAGSGQVSGAPEVPGGDAGAGPAAAPPDANPPGAGASGAPPRPPVSRLAHAPIPPRLRTSCGMSVPRRGVPLRAVRAPGAPPRPVRVSGPAPSAPPGVSAGR